MDLPPRFRYPIAIALVAAFLISTGSTPARAAGIGDYAAPFQSVINTFENIFAQLVALIEPHHTVTVELSPALWHASGKTASAAAFNSILATSQPTASPTIVHIDTPPKASTSAVHTASVVVAPPVAKAPQEQLASYVTQTNLTTQLQQLTNKLTTLVYQNVSAPNSVIATGGITNEIAATNRINQLSGVAITGGTITNATINGISGLTAADIPALAYLSTSGGSLSGALGIGTTSPSDLFALNGAAYLADITAPPVTTNRLYSNNGNLYWAGNLLGGATTGNWSSDGTNVWRVGGNVGIGTSSPTAAALVVAGSSVDLEGNNPAYNFYSTGANLTRWGLQVLDANNDFRILDGGSDYFHITQGGNVGVSSSTPGSLFSIGNTGGINFSLGTSTFSTTGGLNITGGCFAVNGTCLSASSLGGNAFDFTPSTFGATASNATSTLIGFTNGIYALASSTIGNGNQNGGLTILGRATTTGQAYFGSNVGIGTTSPYAQLTVAPNNASGNPITLFAIASSTISLTTTLFSVSNVGKVTLGDATGNVTIAPTDPTNLYSITASGNLNIGFNSGGALTFLQGAANRFTVAANGEVGIGTSSPTAGNLVVAGSSIDLEGNNPAYRLYSTGAHLTAWTLQVLDANNDFRIIDGGSDYFHITEGGNVGIGTSTPYNRLTLWGPDTASSTLSFNIVNNASTTVFAVFDGGNAQLSGTLTQSSDARLKTNIQSLDASTSLAAINSLTPVAYDWLDPNKGGVRQYGFIAQQVAQVFPNLVSTTSATALTPDGTLGLNYIGLIAPLVEAVQQLSAGLNSIASRVSALEATVAGFANRFTTKQLCVEKSDGTPVCLTGDQLAGILSGTPSVQISAPTPPTISGTSTPPSINIQGSNPATINVGDTYTDLGAIVTDNQGHDLSYRTFINGVLSGNILIDTAQVATDTIDYVATDTWGNTATGTRTVIVDLQSI